MKYHFTKDKLVKTNNTKKMIEFIDINDYDKRNLKLPLNLAGDIKKKYKISKLDVFEDFWYFKLCLSKTSFAAVNDMINFLVYPEQVYIIYSDNIDINELLELVNQEYHNLHLQSKDPALIIFLIVSLVMKHDNLDLPEIQEQIDDLEDTLIKEDDTDYQENILKIRKRLVSLRKRYFSLNQALYTITSQELVKKELNNFVALVSNNANRIYHELNNLVDHTMAIKEMYLSIITTKMSDTMNFFTIVSSVFLPLTLIVGWYGMNLKMPEFEWKHGYLVIIILSLIVLSFSIFYIRKNGFLKRK